MKNKILKILTITTLLTLSLCIITACGGSSHTHEFKNIKSDATNHWYACDCGETTSKDHHKGGTATCKSKAVCSECGVEYGDLAQNHLDNGDGICSLCDAILYSTQGLKFELSSDQTYVEVVGYEGDSQNIIIANHYNNLPITTICEKAFYGNTSIVSVVMSNFITNIESQAFTGCTGLKSIEIKGDNANYTSIDGSLYSKDKKTLIQYAIGNEEESFKLADTVTEIGDYALAYSRFNNLLTLPNTINKIGKYAFKGTYLYSGIELPTNLTAINEYAFSEVEWLTEIKIPSAVKTIESNAFCKCARLSKVTFNSDSQLQTISEYAFSETSLYYGIQLPNSLTIIGNNAFNECKYLSNITIPSSVTNIGYYAFYKCEELKTVTVQKDSQLKIIEFYAFGVCSKLTTFDFGENSILEIIDDRVFYACDSLKNITLPSTLKNIGNSAFHFCQSLDYIYIPKSVEVMGVNVFHNCNWTIIYCEALSEPKDWNVAWNSSNCTVYWGC